MLTVDEVRKRVEHIRYISQDNESAHIEEDQLYRDVLQAIVDMGVRSDAHPDLDMAELAREALKTCQIEFARWCA